jgi:PAS domain S-box-containing protein
VKNKTKAQLLEELQGLRSHLAELERLEAEHHEAKAAADKHAHDLEARVKELNCLYAISDLRERPNLSLEEMLERIVDLLPSAWQYPEITCAWIVLGYRTFRTDNYRETPWRQACDIMVHGHRIGALEVCYLEKRPERDEGPFVKEERRLITAIAERLGRIAERVQVEEALRDSERKYSTVIENSLTGIYIEQDGKIVFANNRCAEIYGFSKDDLLGMDAWRLVHPEDRPLAENIATRRLTGDRDVPSEYEIRSLRKDGEVVWIKRRNTRIEYQGTPAILGNIVEITHEKLSERKERILETIFQKLGRRESIRLKDVFTLIIPELADVMTIQSSALFSISPDRERVTLEAGYPEKGGYHGVGKVFSTDEEPYFNAVIHQAEILGEYEDEKVDPSYILINDPSRSRLLTENLRRFTVLNNINSILYIPLKTGGIVNYFLAFDAVDKHTSFSKDQIELLVFFGKELMKAVKIEQLDDIIHDFRNPAIATAGFARRIKNAIENRPLETERKRIFRDLDVLVHEASRIQEMAFSVYGEGREENIDMGEKLTRRLEINRQVIQEQKRRNIQITEDLRTSLWIRCYPLHIDRVFDNLLSNATNAIPEIGGRLIVRSYPRDRWAVAEITNTGTISEFQREQILKGETRGRGLRIINRLVKIMGGRIELEVGKDCTRFMVHLPRILESV